MIARAPCCGIGLHEEYRVGTSAHPTKSKGNCGIKVVGWALVPTLYGM